MRFVGDTLVFRLQRVIGDDELAALTEEFAPMLEDGPIERIETTRQEIRDGDHVDLPRIGFRFDRHKWSMLRMLIDRLNDNTPA